MLSLKSLEAVNKLKHKDSQKPNSNKSTTKNRIPVSVAPEMNLKNDRYDYSSNVR